MKARRRKQGVTAGSTDDEGGEHEAPKSGEL